MKNINNQNTILTIETTSEVCGVSLIKNNKVIYDNNLNNGFNHSITLFNNIDNALKKNKLDMSKIDIIKVSNGPGSFTGIRIGVAAAIGLSEKYNTKIEYVDTLDSLAYNAIGKKDIIISMIDAKCDRAYISIFYSKNLIKVCNDIIVNLHEFCNVINKYFTKTKICFAFVGSGAVNYQSILKNNLNIKYKVYKNYSNLKASSLGYVSGSDDIIPNINYLLSSKAEREKHGIC